MNDSHKIMIALRGGHYMILKMANRKETDYLISLLNDMVRRIFNSDKKDERAPFLNCKPANELGQAWVDVREIAGYYVVEPSCEENDIKNELRKRSLDLQERFVKIMEKESGKGDEWKKG